MTISKHFQSYVARERRLSILQLLVQANGTANDGVIHTALQGLGYRRETRDEIREDIRFLIGVGLVVDEWVRSVQVVNITRRGVDVAEGRVEVEGVEKPDLGVL